MIFDCSTRGIFASSISFSMKISKAWLQTYFDTPLPSVNELAELLTLHAFEIEEIISVGDDSIIDIKVTPNRGHDCLCHRGIAKEISVLLAQPFKCDPLREVILIEPSTKELDVEITDANLCKRFSGAVLKNIKVGPSPDWLKKSLEMIGQRSINNIVDVTNYVMWGLGQPLHAFDADKLTTEGGKRKIVVRVAEKEELFIALDNKPYVATEKDLFITDGHSNALLSIAGVKGGKQAEVDTETTNLIIEAANFDRTTIRRTSKRLNLRTDASQRFENEISPELTVCGLQVATDLILQIAGGELEGFMDVYPHKQETKTISVSIEEINNLLGTRITEKEVATIFSRFGFIVMTEGGTFTVTPPFERLDLVIKEDLVEEVGRIYGYEKIQPISPSLQTPAGLNKRFYYAEKIRKFFLARGFSEVYTSSFRNKGSVELTNAVASDKNFLRQSLSDNLEVVLRLNSVNAPLLGLTSVTVFEIGTVFDGVKEVYALAFAWWMGEGGKKESAAKVFLEETKLELEKVLSVTLTGGIENNVFEIDLGTVLLELPDPSAYENGERSLYDISYKAFSPYPFILRDIALWVPTRAFQSFDSGRRKIEEILWEEASEFLVRLDHFDSFEAEGRVSHAFHLVFQSHERTLSDTEINGLMQKIVSKLEENQGWQVR